MAEQLGVAQLLIGVNTQGALNALRTFKKQAEDILGSVNTNALANLGKGAETTGKTVGTKIAKGIKASVSGLKFTDITEALNFGGALNGTIKDLKDYKNALISLRDTTKTTTPGFNELNGQIDATNAAIKALSSSTDNLNDLLNRTDASQFAEDMKTFAKVIRENDLSLRDTARSIRDAERSLTSYDKASRDATRASETQAKAARELRDAYLGVAGAALKAVAGATSKGVGEGLKLPIFGLPSSATSAIEKARAQIQRLQEQSQTASGKVARLSEGLTALGVGGIAAKGIADTLGNVGGAATEVAGTLDKVKAALASLPGPLRGIGGLDEIFANGAASLQDFAAGFLKAQGELSGFAGPLNAVTDALSALGPEAAAVGGVLAFSFAGFQDLISQSFKPGIDSAREALQGMTADTQLLLEALSSISQASAGVFAMRDLKLARNDAAQRVEASPVGSEENLSATKDLLEANKLIRQEKQKQLSLEEQLLRLEEQRLAAARPVLQLALPSTEQLQPEKRGIQRLTPDVNTYQAALTQVQEQTNLTGFDNLFADLPQKAATTQREFEIIEARSKRIADYFKTAVNNQQLGGDGFGNGEFPSTPLPDPSAYAKPIGPKPAPKSGRRLEVQQEQLEADLLRQQERRRNAQELLANTTKKLVKFVEEKEVVRQQRTERALSTIDDQIIRNRKQRADDEKSGTDRNRRLKDAASSGLIGGAFPALFGQGAGASLGGGLGGLAGGALGGQFGFGLSLIGTSFGQFVDDAITKTKSLVDALKDPIANFDALKEAALLSSKGLETNIDSLIKAGREEEAAALIRGDIVKQFGSGDEFKALQTAYDGVSRNLTKLGVSIVDGLAPALITGANAIADFIDKLSGIKLKTAGDDIQQAKAFIADDPSRQAEFDKLFKENGGQYGRSGKFAEGSVGAAVKASRELLKNNKQLTAEERAKAIETAQVGEAYQRFLSLRKLEKDLIIESFSGDRLRTLELEKQKLALEEARALNLAPKGDAIAADKIRNDFADKRLKLEKETTQEILKQRAANLASDNKIASLRDQAQISKASRSLSGTGVGALQASASYQEAVRAQQNAQAALAATPKDPDALRNLREASEAVVTASATANTQLVEAFRSARREAQDAATALGDAYTNLLSLRTGNQGLGKYLNAQDKATLEQNTFQQLLPLFNAAKAQARNTLSSQGIQNFDVNFSGSTADVNQSILDFIKTVNTDQQAQVSLQRSSENLILANNSLITATSELNANNLKLNDTLIQVIPAVQSLASKDWSVFVNVPGGSASGNVLSAVNSRL